MMTIAEALLKVEKLTELHSFCWEEIPGNDSDRFIDFLKLKFGIDWVKTAKIKKVDNRKTIIISTENNSLSLRRSNENPRTIILEIDDGRKENIFAYEANRRELIMSMYLSVDVGPSLKKFGRVIIDERRILRGIQYCTICGGMTMMGIITVRHEDGREVSFDPKLFHYIEVGHLITNDDVNIDTLRAIMADA